LLERLDPAGPFLVYLAVFYSGRWLLHIRTPQHQSLAAEAGLVVLLLAAYAVGTVLHELGHALVVRLVGGRLLGFQLGSKFASVTFTVGSVPVTIGLGLGLGGSVTYDGYRLPAWRRAAVTAAGPLANVLAAPLCLLLPVARWEASYLALGVLASALQDLAPGHSRDGTSTDGYKLSRMPARLRADAQVRGLLAGECWWEKAGAVEILINGFRLDVPEADDCLKELSRQPDRLLHVFTKPWILSDRPEADELHIVHILSWKILISGELPAEAADLAARRIEWVIAHLDEQLEDGRLAPHRMRYALALARLRQHRLGEVQPNCTEALNADLDADDRATVLALVAIARHALLLSGRQQLDEALALDPDADLVGEATRFLDGGWDTALAAYDQAKPRPVEGSAAA
jgi:hypothetical protein